MCHAYKKEISNVKRVFFILDVLECLLLVVPGITGLIIGKLIVILYHLS